MKNLINTLIISILFLIITYVSLSASARNLVINRAIGEGEYIDCTDIEEVIVEEGHGITEIPDYAFLGCTGLKKVSLPDGLKKIGYQAFSECSSLEEVNFPESLEDIGSNAFAYCSSLDNLDFPSRLKHIGHNAFSFCSSLSEAVLPDSLEEVESYAFSDCDSLKKVRLPASDRMLGELIMNCCASLVEIEAPSVIAPKFDCDSFIFDPLDEAAYMRCRLIVPAAGKRSYDVSKSWQMFNQIVTHW